ncbi:hypothetical protein TVAG_129530 [Trichomonas vaginalis G3]|uniref:Uncharacterized protein n=1 Tax=Trichomonas vaginalis (strain ATCC PRA-98 / G3) TaxID=412133 RepID=A2DI49_TRIV3|nr:hypothetical protein TVAGG3_0712690 [Trichomonas vaginalis G3]EAY19845.1 hypothetical protein TVAG_129530 [Trichomonas vaginalis G3]KAI5510027.1 hypothetical protein TVAGG3_0712690 [Trichomonas vaginalis G3]|eukprot:XP_001580831.1 hypothetical protein [Trichomonas vaginalis G3]
MSEVAAAPRKIEGRGRGNRSKKYFDSIDWTMNQQGSEGQKPHAYENVNREPVNTDAPSVLAN